MGYEQDEVRWFDLLRKYLLNMIFGMQKSWQGEATDGFKRWKEMETKPTPFKYVEKRRSRPADAATSPRAAYTAPWARRMLANRDASLLPDPPFGNGR